MPFLKNGERPYPGAPKTLFLGSRFKKEIQDTVYPSPTEHPVLSVNSLR